MLAPLAVTYRSVGSLFPDPRNARTHPKRQLDQIAASIREFGFTNPILIDPEGSIIAGHGRLLAAKAMGLREVPTIELAGLSESAEARAADRRQQDRPRGGLGPRSAEGRAVGAARSISTSICPLTGFSTGEMDVILNGNADPEDEVIPAVPVDAADATRRHLDAGRASDRLRRRARPGVSSGSDGPRTRGRRRVPGPAVQRADQRSCQCQGPASRVRHGFRRNERGGVSGIPRRDALGLRCRCLGTAPCISSAWTGVTWTTSRPSAKPSTAIS